MVGEETTDKGAEHRRHPEHGAERPLVLAAFAQRDDVGDQGRGRDREATCGEALNGPPDDETRHAASEPAGRRGEHEKARRQLEDELATVEVAELACEHRGDGVGQQVGRHHPAEVLGAPEVADDRRQGGRDDRLVERREQHAQHHGAEDEVGSPTVEARWQDLGGI